MTTLEATRPVNVKEVLTRIYDQAPTVSDALAECVRVLPHMSRGAIRKRANRLGLMLRLREPEGFGWRPPIIRMKPGYLCPRCLRAGHRTVVIQCTRDGDLECPICTEQYPQT